MILEESKLLGRRERERETERERDRDRERDRETERQREGMWKMEYTINETRNKKKLRLLIEYSAKLAFMAIVYYN